MSDLKEKNFLELLDSNFKSIELLAIKDSPWLQHFGHSNLLYTRATRAIVNYTPIGEYYLRFFPKEDFSYLCSLYPIESRQHILFDCKRFNKYWNPRRDTIAHFFYSSNLTLMPFLLVKLLVIHIMFSITCFSSYYEKLYITS